MDAKRVMVVGGGVTGVCAALDLAGLGIGVDLVEKSAVLGGHAAQLSCKATDRCVQCGACLVHQRIAQAQRHPGIAIHTAAELRGLDHHNGFTATLVRNEASSAGAGEQVVLRVDAVVVATGFAPFDPVAKPYGYGHLADVVTNLELEAILRRHHCLVRPSDGKVPARIAFIQCVGSRDAALGHPWCSRFCCAASLRSAAWIKAHHPGTDIWFFYIDIQNVGGSGSFAKTIGEQIRMVRAIPGDICGGKDGQLRLTHWDPQNRCAVSTDVDMAVLAAGMQPSPATAALARLLGVDLTAWETADAAATDDLPPGVFLAGTAAGPRTIAETVANAGAAAWQAARYLGIGA